MPLQRSKENTEKPYYHATLLMAKQSRAKCSVLDIGCGENPYVFRKFFDGYIGLDIDKDVLRKVSRETSDVNLICASGIYVPFKDESFDLIICTEVLEHLKNPEEAISEISRLLTKGGSAVISIPSLSLPQMIILWFAYKTKKISEKPYQSPDHKREYAWLKVTPHFEETYTLFKLFRNYGMETVKIVTAQQLYTKPKMLYDALLSKIEKLFEKICSRLLLGHYTIFRAEKK